MHHLSLQTNKLRLELYITYYLTLFKKKPTKFETTLTTINTFLLLLYIYNACAFL